MSEEELKKLKEFVLRDIRILDDKQETPKYQLVVSNAIKGAMTYFNPVKTVKLYQFFMEELVEGNKVDAERWKIAIDSYKYYPCFEGYSFKNDYLSYTSLETDASPKTEIVITADILTGPKEIIECAEKIPNKEHTKEEKTALLNALKSFCSVAYTAGNCCPVMKNKGGSGGVDTCWYKLQHCLNSGTNKSIDSIIDVYKKANNGKDKKRNINNLKTREVCDFESDKQDEAKTGYEIPMFGMFHEALTGKKIISNLMLYDYFDKNELRIKEKPQEKADEGIDKYTEFLDLLTTLIIKRGIRIYCKNKLRDIHLNERGLDKFAKKLIEERKAELGIQ